MSVLAFDCSGAVGSVAVLRKGKIAFSETFESPRGRGGALFLVLQRAMAVCGRPERIGVGVGPGSYNGLRTAIAAAEGLRMATGAGLVGVCSVLALPCEGDRYFAVSDARGGVYYFVEVRDRRLCGEFELLSGDGLQERLRVISGLPVFAPMPVALWPAAQIVHPAAEILARLAEAGTPGAGTPEPLYLKPAHITKPGASLRSPGLRGDGS